MISKKIRLGLIIIGLLIVLSNVINARTLVYDDFECDGFGCGAGWNGDWINSYLTIEKNNNNYYAQLVNKGYMKRYFDVSKSKNLYVKFDAAAKSLEWKDKIYIYYYDGKNKHLLLKFDSSNDNKPFETFIFNLSQYPKSINAGLIIESKCNSNYDYFYIDNIIFYDDDKRFLSITNDDILIAGQNNNFFIETNIKNLAKYQIKVNNKEICKNEINLSKQNIISCKIPFEKGSGDIYIETIDGIFDYNTFDVEKYYENDYKLKINKVLYPDVILQGRTINFDIFIYNPKQYDLTGYIEIFYPNGKYKKYNLNKINDNYYNIKFYDSFDLGIYKFNIYIKGYRYYSVFSADFKVKMYNVDKVNKVQGVDNVNSVDKILEPELSLHGTEYVAEDKGKLWLQLFNESNNVVNDGICYLTVYEPDMSYFLKDAIMSNKNENGIYYYDFSIPYKQGVYPAIARCYYHVSYETKSATGFVLQTGSQSGSYTDTYTQDGVSHRIRENTNKRLRGYYKFSNMCGLNISEDLLQGIEIISYGRFNSNSNDYIKYRIYDWSSSSWKTLPNKLTPDGNNHKVTNFINSNNLTRDGLVSSSGELRIQVLDSNNNGGWWSSSKTFYHDFLQVRCYEYMNPKWQEVKGSSEIHVSKLTRDDKGLYYLEIIEGNYTNESFLKGFDIYYFLTSQVKFNYSNIEIKLDLPGPFPCNQIYEVQEFNKTGTNNWDNISYQAIYDKEKNNCQIKFYENLTEDQAIYIRIRNYNKWKQTLNQYIQSLKNNYNLLYQICNKYKDDKGYPNYIIPDNSGTNLVTDDFYISCNKYLTQYYYTNQTLNYILSIPYGHYTEEEMLYLEETYNKVIEDVQENVNLNTLLLNKLQTINAYSEYLSNNEPYHSNQSTNHLIYTKNISQEVWNSNVTISNNILWQIADKVWHYVARYIHGEIRN